MCSLRFRCLISFMIMTVASVVNAQVTVYYDKLVAAIDTISKSCVPIEVLKTHSFGTGTLFGIPSSETAVSGIVVVATAKHVMNGSDTARVIFQLKSGGKEGRLYKVFAEHSKLDIVFLRPVETTRSFSEYDVTTYGPAGTARYSRMKRGQTIVIAGYPLRLGSEMQYLNPVVQMGTIAQVDSANDIVLIDVPVNPGNSGCPAYVLLEDGHLALMGLVFQYQEKTDYVLRPRPDFETKYKSGARKIDDLYLVVPETSSLGRVELFSGFMDEIYELRK